MLIYIYIYRTTLYLIIIFRKKGDVSLALIFEYHVDFLVCINFGLIDKNEYKVQQKLEKPYKISIQS